MDVAHVVVEVDSDERIAVVTLDCPRSMPRIAVSARS